MSIINKIDEYEKDIQITKYKANSAQNNSYENSRKIHELKTDFENLKKEKQSKAY
mgnify:CR=1 FL=1